MKATLTEGSVGRHLLRMTPPMVLGFFSLFAINLVDTFFVAQLGTKQLAAMSFTFPVTLLLINVAIGIGIGTNSVVSRAIGRGNLHQIQRLTTDSLFLAFALLAALSFIGFLTMRPTFALLGAGGEILELLGEYMTIWYFGMAILAVPMVGNNAIRASGDTLFPSLVMTAAALINAILDPILIFGLLGAPRLELKGAAIATVCAYAAALIASLFVLGVKKKMLTSHLNIKEMLLSWKATLYIGLPAAGANLIIPFINGITVWMLAQFGPAAVAAYGVATRIESFGLVVLISLGTCLAAFIGQNWGAQKRQRVQKSLSLSYRFSLGWGVLLAILLFWGRRSIPALFDGDPKMVEIAAHYFLLVPWSYGALGMIFLGMATFNATGKPLFAAATMGMRLLIFYLPVALVARKVAGVEGVFGAIGFSNGITALILFFWTGRYLQK